MSLEEALDPNTSPQRIKEILDFENHEISQALAKNPNTPENILIELFKKYSTEVLNNPKFWLILSKQEKVSEQICCKYRKFLIDYIMNQEHLPSFLIESAINISNPLIHLALTYRTDIPDYYFEKLANLDDCQTREAVAISENTPIYILEKLATDKYEEVIIGILNNKNTPIYILEKLANSETLQIRYSLAIKENIPIYILEKLALDKSPIVRNAVAKNSSINKIIVKQLFEDKNYKPNYNSTADLRAAIELEIKRLNWTNKEVIKNLNKKYNQSNLYLFDKQQLLEFWQYLKSIKSNIPVLPIRKDFSSIEDIPF